MLTQTSNEQNYLRVMITLFKVFKKPIFFNKIYLIRLYKSTLTVEWATPKLLLEETYFLVKHLIW